MDGMMLLNEKDFKDILDGMVDGIITINQKGIILTFNPIGNNYIISKCCKRKIPIKMVI